MGDDKKTKLSDVIAATQKAIREDHAAAEAGVNVEDRRKLFEAATADMPHKQNVAESKKVIGEYLKALLTNNQEVLKDLGESANGGGYLTPLEFSTTLIELMYKQPVMRRYASVLPMSSDAMEVPVETGTVVANWTPEFAAATQSDPTFGQVLLQANNLIGISRVSRQMLNDSAIRTNLVDWIMQRFAAAIGRIEDTAFMVGDGIGKPRGLRQYTFQNTVAQAGANLTGDDIIGLYYKLPYQYRTNPNVVWIMHDTVVAKIRTLKDSTGSYLYQNGYGSIFQTDAQTPTLLGKPVLTQNDIPVNLGGGSNTTEVYFGDLSYYLIGDREEIFSEVSTQEGTTFARHMAAIKVGERVDGKLAATEPFAQLTGVK